MHQLLSRGIMWVHMEKEEEEEEEEEEAEGLNHKMEAKSSVCQPIGTVGDVVEGVVKSIKPYGAFVDLVASMVMILKYDQDKGRVTLSTKKLEATAGDMLRDPRLVFDKAEETAEAFKSGAARPRQVGDVVEGVVQSVEPHGAIVDLAGITGALHVSQISHTRIESAESILKEGDKLKVMILNYDQDKGRITLSTKKLETTPGDMLRDPRLVFDKAEEMAKAFKSQISATTTKANTEDVPGDFLF
ncbi:hypothetical protein QJQ45_003133 [Haematococcus lacustris]|nr:hypothetical protein QJQ45_003133 [Haematococcus lacustris]